MRRQLKTEENKGTRKTHAVIINWDIVRPQNSVPSTVSRLFIVVPLRFPGTSGIAKKEKGRRRGQGEIKLHEESFTIELEYSVQVFMRWPLSDIRLLIVSTSVLGYLCSWLRGRFRSHPPVVGPWGLPNAIYGFPLWDISRERLPK